MHGLNFNADSLLLHQPNTSNDTLTYWLRDTSIPQVDTLRMTYTYEAYDDSLGHNTLRTDTLELTPKMTMARRLKQQTEAMEKWQKALERRHKRGDYSEETPPQVFLNIKGNTSRSITPAENIRLSFEEPVMRLDTAGIHLRLLVDSTKVDAPCA